MSMTFNGTSGVTFPDGTTQSTAAVNGIGVSQSWQDFTSSRSAGVTYTNSTGRPIMVSVIGSGSPDSGARLYINGVEIVRFVAGAANLNYTLSSIIPAGATYLVTLYYGSIVFWRELR